MSMTEFDESLLLKRLKEGDTSAFMQLYDHYHRPLYVFILRFVKLPGTAEDVLQDVFLKLWEIRERINPELSFQAYLYRISRNKVYKLLKEMMKSEETRAGILQQISSSAEGPHLQLQWKQYNEVLQQAIYSLPPQRQRVFKLCREQGKTYDEAAAELGISKNTVKEHMAAATRFIKEYVSGRTDMSLVVAVFLAQKFFF
ncbi:MAG TPA: RNA polymerase sigma-70 factor [Flavisolibacter sp.]|nr:RNA polymerase sigma-70 factor [Flavisolibacter sp.]